MQEKDRELKRRFLNVFTEFKYPFDYHDLLKWAVGNNRLTTGAIESLKFFQANDIRDFAINKIETAKKRKDLYLYLNPLISNYKKGDYKLLNEMINLSDNVNFIHAINYGIREIYEKNLTPECKMPLENLYYKINCSFCREKIIKILVKNNILSDEILTEIAFDSSKSIRKLFAEQKEKN